MCAPEVTAYVALGSNQGDSMGEMNAARDWLAGVGTWLRHSSLYRTAPVGGPSGQADFLNAVVAIEGPRWGARQLLQELLDYELRRGRERSVRWGPRMIDLDLLAYGDSSIDDPLLSLPHPRLHQREFVLAPLCEVAPQWRHPDIGETACALLTRLRAAASPLTGVERLESWVA